MCRGLQRFLYCYYALMAAEVIPQAAAFPILALLLNWVGRAGEEGGRIVGSIHIRSSHSVQDPLTSVNTN